MAQIGIVRIPHRFEALRDVVGRERLGEVLLESRPDIEAVKKVVAEVRSAGQGKLLFLVGAPGTGKTSLAESLRIYLPDVVGDVLTPPPDYSVSLTELPRWLATNLESSRLRAGDRLVVLNLDGREVPPIEPVATQAAMVNLNAFMRNNPNILAVWPVVNAQFAERAIEDLQTAGARTALASRPIHRVQGLEKERFFDTLSLILNTIGVRLADAAVSDQEARERVGRATTIGDYLQEVHELVVARYDLGEIGAQLPKVAVIIASSADVTSACRMLQRGDQFLADADRLLQYSRANVADDWRKRGRETPRRGLSFITSLFEVRLLSLSASAVVNACAFGPDQDLRDAVRRHYPNPVSSNAANTMKNSSLLRALQGQPDVSPGVATLTEAIRKAYDQIQEFTQKRHDSLNRAIVQVIANLVNKPLSEFSFEFHPFDDRELRIDVLFQRGDRPETLEFTYRRDNDASAAVIASYVLTKVQDYARDYGLI